MALRYVSYDTYPDVKLYTSYIDEYTSFTFLILEYISVNEEYRLEIVYFERKDNVFVMEYAPNNIYSKPVPARIISDNCVFRRKHNV